jgi:hypothetical protein
MFQLICKAGKLETNNFIFRQIFLLDLTDIGLFGTNNGVLMADENASIKERL